MQKNILILGGSRFIGYLMLSKLIKDGHNITVFNRQLSVPPAPFPKATTFVRGNRNNPQDLEHLFNQRYDAIIDISGFTPDHVEPIIKKYSSRIGHYIFISTTSVFKTPSPPNPMTEESPRILLKNTYGGDKALTENLLLNYKKVLPVTVFRPQGVIGPYEPNLEGLVFYRIINNFPILVGKNINVQMNHLLVFDLIRAITLSIGNSKTFGKIYNIANDDKLNLIEFINLCGKICSITPIIKHEEMISKYKNINFVKKKRHVDFFAVWPEFDLVCNNSLVKEELKIKFTSIKESLSINHSWLMKDIKRLNYFSLRGERYILYNRSVPFYQQYVWKIIDFFKFPINKFEQSLIRINFLRNTYHLFKSIGPKRRR
jgi:nucleoside-diphosphate-sugar epimerase